jgi:ubiquinone biosynthesis protein UbiJ
MDILGTLFRPLALLANRRISEQTPARELAAELDGRTFAVRVRDTALAVFFTMRDGKLIIASEYEDDPDVAITGSLITLSRLSGADAEALFRDGSVEIAGDAEVAALFQRLFRFARPDLEDELSNVVGDVAAHQAGKAARGIVDWGRQVAGTMERNVGEYLTEERRALPARTEFEAFREDTEKLRDDVARAEARLARLRARLGTGAA